MTATLVQGQLCQRFWLVHKSGDRLYPYVKTTARSSSPHFAVAKPGSGNNLASAEIPVTDETELERLVLQQRYSVRCRTQDSKREGLYNIDGHSILRFERV